MRRDELWGNPIILREVQAAFEAQRARTPEGDVRVSVIIGVFWGVEPGKLVAALQEMGVPEPIRATDRFVCASITESELARIAARKDLVFKVWDNQSIVAMARKPVETKADESLRTIKADAARRLFDADGAGVAWAVLDTGIRTTHKLLADARISRTYHDGVNDLELNFSAEDDGDLNGHGTHIAGIIHQIAPQAALYDVKVLTQKGGASFDLIQAMYMIRKINLQARRLVIHGANLSLGGPAPVGSYGCGHSPQCQEANWLAESGVVVCVAAGNDGHKVLQMLDASNAPYAFPSYIGLGINDPGNAEKVITVGSVHKTAPHLYGVSYFSSKGPTGDGRLKPDVVAPGERIYSSLADSDTSYDECSGTSQATAEVSGAIAQFLSVKPEFMGRPDDVKELLLRSCTDLKRDRAFQGAGLVDVLRMIQSV